MKIITILNLWLTASLSFAHSVTLDKTNDNAFTYDDSGLCADIPNCYPSMKNLTEIDDNSRFPPIPLRVGESVSACGASFGGNFSFIIAGADGRKIINFNKKIDEYEAIYNKYSALGFPSKADANAYFNIHILNNTPNNQLGYLRWITYDFNLAIDQDASTVELHKNSYLMHFGTTITKQLAHQKGLKILYIQDLKKPTTNPTAVQPYIIIPQLFKVFNNSIVGLSNSSMSIISSSPRHTSNDKLESFYSTTCLYKTKEPISIIQQPKNQIISTKIMNFVHEQINDWECPEAFAKRYQLYLVPIDNPSKIYAQTNQLGHLRWITELAHRATNDNTLDIQVSKNSYLINFGTKIIEPLIFLSIQNPFCTTQFKPCSAQIIDTIIIQPGLKPKPKRVIHDF